MSMNVLMRLFFWCGVVELALGMPNQTHPAARRPFLLLQQQLARALQPPPPLVLSQQLLLGYQQLQQQQQAANLAAQQLAVQVASNGDPIVNLRSAQLPLGGMDVPAVEPEALIERLTYTYMMETPLGLLEPRFTAQVWAVGGRMMFADHDYMTGTPAGRRYIPWVGVSMFANDTIGDTFHNGMNLMTVEARRWEFSNRTEFDPGDGTGSMLSSRLPLHVRSSQQGELPPTWPGFLHPPVATGDAVFCSRYSSLLSRGKLLVLNVSWSSGDTSPGNQQGQQQDNIVNLMNSSLTPSPSRPYSLSDNPLLSMTPGVVFNNNDTQNNLIIKPISVDYHITTYSNKPMDMTIELRDDVLNQTTPGENTYAYQVQQVVRAQLNKQSKVCNAKLLGGYEGTVHNGTAIITRMRLRALKGENYSIRLHAVDAYGTFREMVEPLVVNITIPPCSIGEVPRDEGYLCQKCAPHTVSLWQDTKDLYNCSYPPDITCYPCPDGGECPGGAVVVPRRGFWHSAANSTFMNACPNPQACRDGDDDAQDVLVACQEWWYSLPNGFDYQGFVDSVLSGSSSTWLNSLRASGLQNDAAIAAAASINVLDPRLCMLWGVPYDHPASYMQKQCTNGYKGRLCAICANDDGVMRASNSDFECNTCYTRHTSIVITILSFVANVATVLFTIIVTFMTDYTEDENMGIGDLFKVFIVHMQFFIIVTRININWPTSISFITSLMSACTGVVARVYAPSCMLDASATPEDVAAITQLVAIISPLLTILVVAVLWMIIRVIVFNLDNATRTEQKLDMRTINEYKTDRVRRLMEKRQDDGDDGLATGTSSDSPYCLYGHGYDAYMDLRAVDLLPAASYGQVEAGGTITTNTQQTNEAGTPLGIPPPPPPALNPCEVGRTYGGQGGAGLSYVHTGLPIQEGSVVEEMERSSSGAAFREGDEQHGDQQQQKWHLSLAHMEQKPSSVGSREEAKLPDKASWRSPSTQNRATEMAATVLPEEEAEKEHDSPNDAFYFPGAGNSRRPLLPLPPRPNEMPAAATSKKGLPPPSPPPAPLPSPPAPSPPQLSDAKVQADDGNETDGSGSVRHVRPASTPNVDGNPGSDPGSYIRSQSVPQVVAVAAGVPCPNDAGTTKSTQRSVVTSRTPSRSPLSLTTRASLEPLAQVPATSSPAAPPRSTGEGISINAGGGTSPQRGFESRSSQLSEVITNNATGSAEGSSAQVPAPLKGKSNSGRSKYKNLAVRLVGLDSFREMDTAVHTGTTGSDRAATGGGMNQAERGREGGRAAVIGPNGSQSPSEYLRRKLTEGSTWVRSFFTYDEEAAPLDGQVRWASLANIHRTMAWWRQELLIVMIACFVLYPAWAQATLQIFACYYLDDGTGFYPEHQLAQWGKGYWILNMNQECYLGQHARVWVPIGIVCIFIICAGIPLLTFMATWTHRTALGTVHVVQTYGFLYRRYNHENFYWWESAMQVQTLLLVVVDVFGRILAVYQQAVLLMLVLMLVMWANMFFQPLKHKVLERMSNLSLAILSFTVALGLFFIPPVERKDPVTSAAATAIGAIIVILNAGLLLYFIFVIWIHGREAINRKVEAAKQRVVTVGAKVHTGTQKVLRAIRHRVSSASRNLHSASLQSVFSRFSQKGGTPPLSPSADS